MIQKRFRWLGITGILFSLIVFAIWQAGNEQTANRESAFYLMTVTLESIQLMGPDRVQIEQWIRGSEGNHPEWRITWIRADGTVIHDSEIDADLLANHSDRPELIDAKRNGIGYSTRESSSLHQTYLYTAVKLHDGSFLRLAFTESVFVNQALSFKQPLLFLAFCLVLLILLLGRTAFHWFRHWTMYMRTIKDWSEMHFLSRMDVLQDDPLAPMAIELNKMASNVQEQLRQRSIRFARLKTIVEFMQTGVVLLDDRVRIVMTNDSAEQLLGFKIKDSAALKRLSEVVPYEVYHWIEHAMDGKERSVKEWHVYYPEDRILLVELQPLPMLPDGEAALLVMIQDVTPLRRLEKIRSEFVANVSHELKTPIAAIRGFSETLLNGAIHDADAAMSFLQVILDESDRLNRLINGLLELSRLESKRAPLQFTRLSLQDVVIQTLKVVQSEANQKQISIQTQIPQQIALDADFDRLHQVILNLLSNAVHYTQEGGRVSVQAEMAHDKAGLSLVQIAVSDNGMGIHQDDLPRIFERFYRVDKARSRSSGGTGLGLSIVKHIVELHHGSIHVESRLGKGSRFIVSLPVEQQSTEAEGGTL